MDAFNASIFVLANADDARNALAMGPLASEISPTWFVEGGEPELRSAFDVDRIVADDSSEGAFKSSDLATIHSK